MKLWGIWKESKVVLLKKIPSLSLCLGFIAVKKLNCKLFWGSFFGFFVGPDKILKVRVKPLVTKCSSVNVFSRLRPVFILRAATLSDPLWIKKKNNSHCNWNENLHSYAVWGLEVKRGKFCYFELPSRKRGEMHRGEVSSDTEQGTSEHGDVTHTGTFAVWSWSGSRSGSSSMMVMLRFGWTWYKSTVISGISPFCFKFSSPVWKCPDFKKLCGTERSQLPNPK